MIDVPPSTKADLARVVTVIEGAAAEIEILQVLAVYWCGWEGDETVYLVRSRQTGRVHALIENAVNFGKTLQGRRLVEWLNLELLDKLPLHFGIVDAAWLRERLEEYRRAVAVTEQAIARLEGGVR